MIVFVCVYLDLDLFVPDVLCFAPLAEGKKKVARLSETTIGSY